MSAIVKRRGEGISGEVNGCTDGGAEAAAAGVSYCCSVNCVRGDCCVGRASLMASRLSHRLMAGGMTDGRSRRRAREERDDLSYYSYSRPTSIEEQSTSRLYHTVLATARSSSISGRLYCVASTTTKYILKVLVGGGCCSLFSVI
jgi:hypothetical protein